MTRGLLGAGWQRTMGPRTVGDAHLDQVILPVSGNGSLTIRTVTSSFITKEGLTGPRVSIFNVLLLIPVSHLVPPSVACLMAWKWLAECITMLGALPNCSQEWQRK